VCKDISHIFFIYWFAFFVIVVSLFLLMPYFSAIDDTLCYLFHVIDFFDHKRCRCSACCCTIAAYAAQRAAVIDMRSMASKMPHMMLLRPYVTLPGRRDISS